MTIWSASGRSVEPDPVDRPVRIARTTVHHYNGTQYCNTETVWLIFPFLQTNITPQMWPRCGNEKDRKVKSNIKYT